MNKMRGSFLLSPPLTPSDALPASAALLRQARFALREEFLVKIRRAVDALSDDQIWWRPNEESNSIGNLLLHLSGNARQWIIAGIGGAADLRNRNLEFSQREQIDKSTLLDLLSRTLAEVDDALADLEDEIRREESDAPMQRICTPQGFDQTVLDALCHVVQHFSYHTGQIVYIAKLMVVGSVAFYDDRLLGGKKSA